MKTWSVKTISSAGILVFALLIANVLNLVFNAYLGRNLSYSQFATVTLINTLWYLIAIVTSAFGITVTHRVAYLASKYGKNTTVYYYDWLKKKVYLSSLIITLVYLVSIPVIARFFNIQNLQVFLLFTPAIVTGAIAALNRGFLHGNFHFSSVAAIVIGEAVSKVIIVFMLVSSGNMDYSYLSIPMAVIVATLTSVILVYFKQRNILPQKHEYHFSKRFYLASLITALSSNAFLTFDISLVKHYFSPDIAGYYALLSMVGKMIFFIGSLLSIFIIAFVGRDIGSKRSPHHTFYLLFTGIVILVGSMTFVIAFFGQQLLPLMFGDKIVVIFPYLKLYSLTIAFYTLAHIIVYYHLALKQYVFPVTSIIMSFIMAIGIVAWHSTIGEVVNVMSVVAAFNLVITIGLHFLQKNGGFFVRNVIDFFSLLLPLPESEPSLPNGKRILIFNWRDTRHNFAGGAEVYLHELAKRWVKQGNKVTLFCGNDGLCPRSEIIEGVEIIRRGGFYFVYIWAFFYYIFKFRGRYDVIIDSENGIPFFTPLFARGKIFLLVHHVHQEVFRKSLKPPLSWIASFLEIKLMPYVYRNIQVMTVSPSSKEEIIKYSLASMEPIIVYNGVDLDIMKPAEKHEKPLVAYVGRLKYYKSLNIFIKAAREVVKSVPDAQFIIAGDGEERNGLVKLVQKLAMEKHITFVGRVSEEEKTKLYQQAWVFVNPSFMEGWGITSIEANACGTPVVASDVPGLRDSVKHKVTGLLTEYGNVYLFAENITKLLTDKNLRADMSKQAVVWAQKFDWNKSAADGLKVLKIRKINVTKTSRRLNWHFGL